MIPRRIPLALVGLLAFSQWASAQTFEEFVTAYKQGDTRKALELTRVLAERGDARAEANLGAFYRRGYGVARVAEECQRRSLGWVLSTPERIGAWPRSF